MRVDATSYADACEQVVRRAQRGEGGYVCVSTVHMVMEAYDDPDYRRIINGAFLVTPDGMPLVWALRWLGCREATRVYGPTLMPLACAAAEERGIPVGFYGGTPETRRRMLASLRARFPKLDVACALGPPFRPLSSDEDLRDVQAIRSSGARILFVGLGCPKQERWMAAHADRLDAVMLGVGAAFDFAAGTKAQAPAWLQASGLEWLFRLASEPRRLWRRYLRHNPRFVYRLALELWSRP
jgi:N-acetylglucosaminyldiphosphoundecaprenol N-acetyl-beta-D-mannosaminyltransferase